MRLREVFRYEIEHRLRRPMTWVLLGIQVLLTLWTSLATYDEAALHFNAPVRIAGGLIVAGMAGILISAAIFGDAALRDVEAEMHPLLYTSRLTRTEYLGGRLLASLTVNAFILLAIPLTQIAATRLPLLGAEQVGPLRLIAYLQPFLLYSLPNLLLFGTILFTIGAFARQTIPVYLGAIGLFVGYIAAISGLEGVQNRLVLALADPLGIGVLQSLTRYWTPAESNARLIGFPAIILLNRAVWLAMTAAVLLVLFRRFRFAHDDGGGRRKDRRTIAEPGTERARTVAVPRVAGTFGRRARVRQVLAVARHSLEEIALSRAFLACMLVAMGLTLLFGWNVSETVFDTSTWPVTHLVAQEVMTRRITPIIVLLIALFAGELVWKDRDVGAAEIVDASPVPVGVLLPGRFLALVLMLVMLQAAFMAAGMLLQALQGYYRFEPGLYARILFGIGLVDWILIAALAMTIHVIVNQKYLAHLVVILVFVFTKVAAMFGLRHHLLIYGTDPGWTYSEMNGLGPYLGPLLWFKAYWAAWALLLAVLASLLWVRGRETALRHRLVEARARFAGGAARTAGQAVALILVLGGFIFYNTNVLNEYRSAKEEGRPQAEYEKRYKRYAGAPQPTIAAVTMRVEIYPDERAVDLRGTYAMVNRTGTAIDSVHVMFADRGLEARAISFDRASTPATIDDEARYRIYRLDRPLAPGDSLQLTFDLSYRARGFTNGQQPKGVVANGSAFNRSWLPVIGYQPVNELSDEKSRTRFGLSPQPSSRLDDPAARNVRWHLRNEDAVDIDMVIGTTADQIAITPGVLRRSWMENGRRYFHYQTERPAMFGADVFSGRYAVREDRWNDIALQIFHHPAHSGDNVDRTIRSMKASLEYFSREFGPYPYTQLRVVELPPYGGFGRAMPMTISFTEGYFLSRVKEGQVDQPFYGTAHEVAHTWWGGMVRGARMKGAGFLSESFANYSAMMLVEKTSGLDAAQKVYDFQMERYLLGRAEQSGEVPVLDVEDQPYIAYRKGAIAMYTLRRALGEEPVNAALRRYQEKYRDAGPPYPTSRDLYAELRAAAPDSLHSMLEDLFETVTLWDLKLERAVFEPAAGGQYQVTLDVVARKARADSIGARTDVPMDDLIEIGVFARGEGDALGAPLHLKWHRIRTGRQTISITVAQEPARGGIDPHRKLIDWQREDNVFTLHPISRQNP